MDVLAHVATLVGRHVRDLGERGRGIIQKLMYLEHEPRNL